VAAARARVERGHALPYSHNACLLLKEIPVPSAGVFPASAMVVSWQVLGKE